MGRPSHAPGRQPPARSPALGQAAEPSRRESREPSFRLWPVSVTRFHKTNQTRFPRTTRRQSRQCRPFHRLPAQPTPRNSLPSSASPSPSSSCSASPMAPDLVNGDVEITRRHNRNYYLAEGFHRIAKQFLDYSQASPRCATCVNSLEAISRIAGFTPSGRPCTASGSWCCCALK